jgi:hypothetical protein
METIEVINKLIDSETDFQAVDLDTDAKVRWVCDELVTQLNRGRRF